MKKARARYTFRRKVKLAVTLSWIAGFTNVVTFFQCKGQFTSHMTGTSTGFGRTIAYGDWSDAIILGSILFMFFLGAMTSSLLTELSRRRGFRSRFVLPLFTEAALLATFVGMLALTHGNNANPFLVTIIAFAMGLQNAAITRISNAVVRSTHLTGVITDMGIDFVQCTAWYSQRIAMRPGFTRRKRLLKILHRQDSARHFVVLSGIFASFVIGTILGTIGYEEFGYISLILPISFLLMLVAFDLMQPIADIKEINIAEDKELASKFIVPSYLPPEIHVYQIGTDGRNKAPDFQLFIEGLSTTVRIVILTLAPHVELDPIAIVDLDTAARALAGRGTRFIIGGISPTQYKMLQKYKLIQTVGPENIFPDLEFGIALGMQLVKECQMHSHVHSLASASARR